MLFADKAELTKKINKEIVVEARSGGATTLQMKPPMFDGNLP